MCCSIAVNWNDLIAGNSKRPSNQLDFWRRLSLSATKNVLGNGFLIARQLLFRPTYLSIKCNQSLNLISVIWLRIGFDPITKKRYVRRWSHKVSGWKEDVCAILCFGSHLCCWPLHASTGKFYQYLCRQIRVFCKRYVQ